VIHRAPILTFAVPTYNRLECLRLLVNRIASEIQDSGGAVELLVCDNASTDGTAPWLREAASRGRLRLIEQPRNLGADGNILACVQQARGRYIWICGDDDLPLEGAITDVAAFVSERAPALLYLPARWHTGDLGALPAERVTGGPPKRLAAMELALRANAFVTFISSWVLDREAYFASARAGEAGRYVGTSLVQLEWTLTLLTGEGPLYAAPKYWLTARGGNTGGYSLFDTFVAKYHRILGEKLAHRPEIRDFLQDHLLRGYLPGLVWGTRIGALGRFEPTDWDNVEAMLAGAWPQRPIRRAWIGRIARWPRPFARLAMGWCWLDARLWMKALALSPGGG
jgi:glycosyltransferase involved in cell wall biosynthesis